MGVLVVLEQPEIKSASVSDAKHERNTLKPFGYAGELV